MHTKTPLDYKYLFSNKKINLYKKVHSFIYKLNNISKPKDKVLIVGYTSPYFFDLITINSSIWDVNIINIYFKAIKTNEELYLFLKKYNVKYIFWEFYTAKKTKLTDKPINKFCFSSKENEKRFFDFLKLYSKNSDGGYRNIKINNKYNYNYYIGFASLK